MMKQTRVLLSAVVAMGLAGCDSLATDFGDINQDPNRVKKATPESFLAPAIYETTWNTMDFGHRLTNEFVQYSVHNSELNEYHRFVVPQAQSTSVWSRSYTNLMDVVDMEKRGAETERWNYVAIAKIIKSWAFANLTDMFGPVPYHDALQGDQSGPLQPGFDTQEEVYRSILAELAEANTLFDFAAGIDPQQDILFGGDLSLWQKLGNSLQLRLLLRVSNRPEMDAGARIAEILDNPTDYPIIGSNDEAAVLYYSGIRPNISPFYDWRPLEFNGNRRASAFMVGTLGGLSDPRLGRFLGTNTVGEFLGIPSGWAQNPPTNTSAYHEDLQAADQPAIILSHAEVEFIRAEAALKGWISGDPAEHYANGIASSMAFWGEEVPAGYLDQPGVLFDGQLSTLMSQKWIALFWSGMEGWHEYRRTGYPELPIGPGTQNDGMVPTRLRYPSTVQALNATNYATAVDLLGGPDDLQTPVWWAR
ncbi:MAG: SusD/RagB family nutrient-binding outer membrane lipoprotein [Gemmatimonas sp.]|nr:SusD/RagB family nutrient-binding outer membrane lipoprotein [Gemmatimonas sp.]